VKKQPSTEQLEDQLRAAWKDDFQKYAASCLQIRPKDGQPRPFRLNRSQKAIHAKCEDMRRRTGRVRLVVVKSRQVGISTYFTARNYWLVTFRKGFRAFVLTHLDETTDALFGMVKRYHDHVPDFVKPRTGAANAKEMEFSGLDGGFVVSTAGNKGTGRGHTNQIFHGSEVSRWTNATEHVGGVLESVPDIDGSEVILESTANGLGNVFHTYAMQAQDGKGQFEFIFVPWFWHEEYTKEAPADWIAPPFLAKYAEHYKLTRDQAFWAHIKNLDLAKQAGSAKGDDFCWLFRQEYPANANEAFQASSTDSFIPALNVLRARKADSVYGHGPIVLGVDVARGGTDYSCIIDRQGRALGLNVCDRLQFGKDTTPLVSHIIRLVREFRINDLPLKKIVLDATGVGGPVYDVLREQLGPQLVAGVEFGAGATQPRRYANRRAEIWDELRQWLAGDVSVRVKDDDILQRDLCAPEWGSGACRYRTSDNTLVMEDKERIRSRLKISPDYGDAAALTFAFSFDEYKTNPLMTPRREVGEGAWML
jgi:hypothetical protein